MPRALGVRSTASGRSAICIQDEWLRLDPKINLITELVTQGCRPGIRRRRAGFCHGPHFIHCQSVVHQWVQQLMDMHSAARSISAGIQHLWGQAGGVHQRACVLSCSRPNMAPMSTSDCFVSRYTVPRKLSGIDSCARTTRSARGCVEPPPGHASPACAGHGAQDEQRHHQLRPHGHSP